MLKKIGIAASAGVLGLSMLAGAATMVNAQSASNDGLNFFERLATKLGVSEEKLEEAGKAVQYEIIDEKVANGELESDKAVEIKSKIAESDGFMMLGKGSGRRGGMHMGFGRNASVLADFFGVAKEEVEALQGENMSINDMLKKYGKTHEELHTYMEANRPQYQVPR
jgi:hypothetical protein